MADGLGRMPGTESRLRLGNVSRIAVASSDCMPIRNGEAHAVISSPPYLTRIDYVKATKPELAVLGYTDSKALRQLRERLIGAPIVLAKSLEPHSSWGATGLAVMERVSAHPSKASGGYYRKMYLQYFDAISRSLDEINRALSPGGYCVLVVQDSYYKEVHIDLPSIFVEMGTAKGWIIAQPRDDFAVAWTMAGVNQGAKKYRNTFNAVESVLWFHKPAVE